MNSLKVILDRLQEREESEYFRVHYGLRNPVIGRGLGAHGVKDRTLIKTYLRSLDRLYRAMRASPWNRNPPLGMEQNGKINVYVFDVSEIISADGSPFASATRDGNPYICLPSRSFEPSPQAEFHRAEAEAVHEATHVFNFRERPHTDIYSGAWEWVDEAIAVYMETHLIPGNHDHFRFLKNWVDMPEVSLDDWSARYQSGVFACYLENKMPGLLNRLWVESRREERPFDVLSRLASPDRPFSSSDPGAQDLFSSGYCMDSYFLMEEENDWLTPQLHARFGERALTESHRVTAGGKQAVSEEWTLNHLACRYFRILLKDRPEKLRVEVRITDEKGIQPVKAELAAVQEDGRRGRVFPLRQDSATNASTLSLDLPRNVIRDTDHFILVVSNCGIRSRQVRRSIDHDDDRRFQVLVSG